MISGFCILAFFILFFTESLLQFPLYNAPSFFLVSILVAGTFVLTQKAVSVKLNNSLTVSISLCLLLLIVLSQVRIYSMYHVANSRSTILLSNSCEYWPSNWLACIKKSKDELKFKNYEKGIKTLDDILEFHKHHFTALHLKTLAYARTSNLQLACLYAKKYDSIFLNKSRLSKFVTQFCDK